MSNFVCHYVVQLSSRNMQESQLHSVSSFPVFSLLPIEELPFRLTSEAQGLSNCAKIGSVSFLILASTNSWVTFPAVPLLLNSNWKASVIPLSNDEWKLWVIGELLLLFIHSLKKICFVIELEFCVKARRYQSTEITASTKNFILLKLRFNRTINTIKLVKLTVASFFGKIHIKWIVRSLLLTIIFTPFIRTFHLPLTFKQNAYWHRFFSPECYKYNLIVCSYGWCLSFLTIR